MDEKSQIQALDRTAPLLPMRPGQIKRRTQDYARHGTTNLFAALDTKTGKVIGQTQQRHRSEEFRKFLDTVELIVPPKLDIHLILDNYRAHKTADRILDSVARFCERTLEKGHKSVTIPRSSSK